MKLARHPRIPFALAVVLCAASLSAACNPSAPEVAAPARDEERLRDEEHVIDNPRDEEHVIDTTRVARDDGSTILAEGTFEVTVELGPLSPPGSKLADSNGVWLRATAGQVVTDSDRWLLISGGPPDWTELDGQTVRVTGRVIELDPYSAHLGVPHFEADAVELLDDGDGGETTLSVAEASLSEAEMEKGYETTYSAELALFEATVRIDAEPGGKMFQGVWLERDGGGESLLVSYRKTPEWEVWDGQRVEIAGRRSYPGPLTQHVMAQHFKVEHVQAAPELAPTFTGESETHEGVVRLSGSAGKKTTVVRLELADGAERVLRYGTTPVWDGLDGKRVQLTGRPFTPGHPQQVAGEHLWPDTVVVLE